MLSEQNITNIIKSITDKLSYVISKNGNNVKFVIEGYYFEVNTESIVKPIYVKLNRQGVSGDPSTVIKGDNGSNFFEGIDYNSTGGTGYFQILDGDGNIPENSKIKFTQYSIQFDTLDAGEVPPQTPK